MEKDISEINKNFSKFIQNLLELQDTEYDKKLLNGINIFKEVLEQKRNEKIYFQDKQDNYDELKQKFKDYYESILKIYENDCIKNIKNYIQDLKYYINNINLSESKDSSENISTNQESDKATIKNAIRKSSNPSKLDLPFIFFIRKMYQPKWTDTLTIITHNKKLSKNQKLTTFCNGTTL